MKLVIDIPEIDYNTYKHFGNKGTYSERIIANGTPYEERPKGKWEYVGMGIYECTNCKAEYEAGLADHCNINNSEFKYCPNCGADMRGNEI